jgi:hypothetical protein
VPRIVIVRSLLLSIVAAAALMSCAAEESTILVTIDAERGILVPDDVNEVRVEVTASRGSVFCGPYSSDPHELATRDDFPLTLLLTPGEVYRDEISVRVIARSEGQDVMRLEAIRALPNSGDHELWLQLEAACLGMTCDGDQTRHCFAGECQGTPAPGVFDQDIYDDDCERD